MEELAAAQEGGGGRNARRVVALTATALAAGAVTGGVAFAVASGGNDGAPQAAASAVTPRPSTPGTSGSGTRSPGSAASIAERGGSAIPAAPGNVLSSGEPGRNQPGGEIGRSGGGATPASTPPPPPPSSSPPTAQPAPARHLVQEGESLWTITASALGTDAAAQQVLDTWPKIYEANRSVIGADPNLIHTGQELVIPALT